MRLRALGACAALLFATGLLVTTTPADVLQAQQTGLTGKWRLNEAQSDDAQQKMQEMFQQGGGRGGYQRSGAGRGGRGGGGGRGGRGAPGGGDVQQGQTGSAMRSAMRASQLLQISQTDVELQIGDETGQVRTLYTDGRKVKREAALGGGEVKTKWKEDKLVVEQKYDRGLKITETYELVDEGRQLLLKVRIEGLRFPQPLEIRRVYDAVGASP